MGWTISPQEARQAVTSVGHAMLSSGRAHGDNYEYERGAYDALRSMALALDVNWDEVIAQIREAHNDQDRISPV